jgi:hypothetical protein
VLERRAQQQDKSEQIEANRKLLASAHIGHTIANLAHSPLLTSASSCSILLPPARFCFLLPLFTPPLLAHLHTHKLQMVPARAYAPLGKMERVLNKKEYRARDKEQRDKAMIEYTRTHCIHA